GCGGCGDVAGAFAVDLAALEHRRAGAEDEINASLDVTVLEELAAIADVERVLPAQKSAAAEDLPIAAGRQRQRLGHVARRRVGERQALGDEVIGQDGGAATAPRPDGPAAGAG